MEAPPRRSAVVYCDLRAGSPRPRGRETDLDDHTGGAQATDDELVADLLGGDDDALRALYRRYARPLYAMVLRMLGDEQATEEIVQDALVRVWRRAGTFDRSRASFPTWLLGIAHNLAVDELRRRRVRPVPFERPAGDEATVVDEPVAVGRAYDPQALAEAAEVGATVRAALGALPGAQRAAIELAYFGGLTQREIAAATGAPLGTIKSRIHFGMLALRTVLGELHGRPARREPADG